MGSKKPIKPKMVDLNRLRLCADLTTGQICLGVPNSEGEIVTLDKDSVFLDVSNDFYIIMQNIVEIKLAAVKNANRNSVIKDTDVKAAINIRDKLTDIGGKI
jgi:hypothetical protein